VAAALLGHADTATTLGVYTHSAEDLERKASAAVADLVGATLRNNHGGG